MRILVVAQAAVQQNPGGAEVAAENLAHGLSEYGHEVHLAFAVPHTFASSTVRVTDDAVFKHAIPSLAVHPTFWNEDSRSVCEWRQLVARVKPDIIHAHHFFNVGTNVLAEMCLTKPTFLTLHEYLAMCLLDGQLIRRSGSLCRKPSELDCLNCNRNSLLDGGLSYVRARNASFKRLLDLPQALVAPSDFLKNRFVDWGIAEHRIQVVPNVLRSVGRDFRPQNLRPTKIVYMSSITKLKGAELLVRASSELARRGIGADSLQIEIWGLGAASYMKDVIQPHLEHCGELVHMKGRFERDDLDTVLSGASAVICPSIWYENRPTVLDEAILRGIPIITSNIGGMKELATSVAGLTFQSGSVSDLADVIERFMLNRLPRQKSNSDPTFAIRQHLMMYGSLKS